ncbi:MAG: hypothetical protein ACFFDF_06985, partial [Candidatus Odinarchaeota archaeon]
PDEIKSFEARWLNKLKSYGLTHFEFSRHVDKLRLNDPRNTPPIEIEELDFVLDGFLKKMGSQLKTDIEKVKNNVAKRRGKNKNDIPPNNLEFTVKSNSKKINFTFALKQNFKTKGTAVIVPITIMRKKGWKTIKGEEIIVERREIFDMDLVDKYLNENFTPSELQTIRNIILKLKNIYSSIEFDPMFLFSIIEKSAPFLKSNKPYSFNVEGDQMEIKMPKESILISAEDRMNSFKDWPGQFKRQTKEDLERANLAQKTRIYEPEKAKSIEKLSVIKLTKTDEDFELRTMKRPFIETKPFPYIPHKGPLKTLLTLKEIVEEDYDIKTIGRAFEVARNNIKKNVLHVNYLWDLSKYANVYQKIEPNLGLSSKEKSELIRDIDNWIKLTIQKFGNLKESQKFF